MTEYFKTLLSTTIIIRVHIIIYIYIYRSAFLDVCNNSEVRHLFIHLPSDGLGCIKLPRLPPSELSNKALFFLKCSNASRLSKENISEDVVYSECSQLPMEQLELVVREVYLPMLSSQHHLVGISSERILDVLHRLMGSVQVRIIDYFLNFQESSVVEIIMKFFLLFEIFKN